MSEITLEILQNNISTVEIEQFIETSTNGTIFHSPRFLSYHDKSKWESRRGQVHNLLFRKGRQLCGFMPGMIFDADEGLTFKSPYGGSYGSFVHTDASFDQASAMVTLFFNFLKDSGINKAHLVPAPACYSRKGFRDYFQFLLLSNGFRIDKTELLMVVELASHQDFPIKWMDKGAKHAYRKAEKKGVRGEISGDYDSFYKLLKGNLGRHDSLPTHSLEEIHRLRELFPDRVVLWLAEVDGVKIAAALFFIVNDFAANCFYVCHNPDYVEFCGPTLLMVHALSWLAKMQYKWLDWGPSSFGYEPHLSLIRFKQSFGGYGALRFYLSFSL